MSDHKEPDFSVSVYEEIESWPAKYRLKLIQKLLERELSHGDHPQDVKTPMYALVHRLRLYEYEADGHVGVSFGDDVTVTDKVEAAERPWWAGKDVVGMLLRRGWEFSPDGMVKKGPGMLSNPHIPAKDIIECHEVPEKGADRLEQEAKERTR
jgi:hypothetical protein